MKRIFVSSKLRAPSVEGYELNIQLARNYCLYVLNQGYNPYAPHIFYTQFMNDNIPEHRAKAFTLCFEELSRSDELWYFLEPGQEPSEGMLAEIEFAKSKGIPYSRIDFNEQSNQAIRS